MPDPLALYIHWPFCKAKCPYCDFNSHVREKVEQERWKAALLAELSWFAARLPKRRLTSIFFGGGTPSLMPPETAAALIEAATGFWPPADEIEITLEANPTSSEASRFHDFRRAGVNRVSLGLQALNAEALHFLGREHSAQEGLKAVEMAAGIFPRYSFDLIYARPHQTRAAWAKELHEALKHAGGHLSLYQLTIEENTAFYHSYHHKRAFDLPEDSESAALYLLTQDMMEEAGLPAYEISNHARPGEESRHNLAYWLGQEYAGIGPGAHGRIRMLEERTSTMYATQTVKSPERWLEQGEKEGRGLEAAAALTDEERREEWLMMRLRLCRPLRFEESPYVIDSHRRSRLAADGLIAPEDGGFSTTPRGRLLLNYITGALLA